MVASGIVPNLDILQLPGKALYVRPGAKQTPSIRPHISGKIHKYNARQAPFQAILRLFDGFFQAALERSGR